MCMADTTSAELLVLLQQILAAEEANIEPSSSQFAVACAKINSSHSGCDG